MPLNLRFQTMGMKKTGLLILVCLSIIITYSQTVAKTIPFSDQKLVVGIVVDQMRWDYLYRYYNRYGDGGLKD
jgi:hypothetical protein